MSKALNIIKLYNPLVNPMESFETKPKKWGNSLGITIPKAVIDKEHLNTKKRITVFIMPDDAMEGVRKLFGKYKSQKSTQEIMNEIDEGYD